MTFKEFMNKVKKEVEIKDNDLIYYPQEHYAASPGFIDITMKFGVLFKSKEEASCLK